MHEFLCDPANRFHVSLNTRVDCSTRETFPRKQCEWFLCGLIHCCLQLQSSLCFSSFVRFSAPLPTTGWSTESGAKHHGEKPPPNPVPPFFFSSLSFLRDCAKSAYCLWFGTSRLSVRVKKKKKMKRILGESKSYIKHQQCIENMVDWDLDCEPFPR